MKIKSKVGLHNEFDFEVRDIRTGIIRQRAKAYNILLNAIYGKLCGRSNFNNRIVFGRGTGTLSPTRTGLFSEIGRILSTVAEEIKDAGSNIYYQKTRIVLAPASYVGETITEVGIAWHDGVGSHAMLQDSEGNQISINKTQFDEITIYATVYFQLQNNASQKIKFTRLPAGNALLNYLFGAGWTNNTIQAGKGRFETEAQDPSIMAVLGTAAGTFSSDVPNKKSIISARFETNNANGIVSELGFSDVLRANLPNSLWNGYRFTNRTIATGDGVTKDFNPPEGMLLSSNPAVFYINGAVVSNADYVVSYNTPAEENIAPYLANVKGAKKELLAGGSSLVSGTFEIFAELTPELLARGITSLYCPLGGIGIQVELWSRQHVGDAWQLRGQVSATSTPVAISLPAGHEFLKVVVVRDSSAYTCPPISLLAPPNKILKFNTPPANGAIITGDFSIGGIPKNANHVLDVSFTIQWGEGQ